MAQIHDAEAIEPLDQWRTVDIIDDEVEPPASEPSNTTSDTEARLASTMPGNIMVDSGVRSTSGDQSSDCASSGASTHERGVQTTESLGSEYDFCRVDRPQDVGATSIVNNGTLNLTVQKFYQVNATPASAEVGRPPPEIENAPQRNNVWSSTFLPFIRNVIDTVFSSLIENWVAEDRWGSLWKWLILVLRLFLGQ
ncbi:hypothetical protein JR316_0000155 [Psilocybe cubensis]|uniref:Uncharacterized protein n=2 Tax=Psilocybe cubensis TaxID=181762 RepID=A0ACB8HDY4_PSICU|nr:hypothetical protein JR316_0000155 [Psilocybe cubensis]KAH9486091.1 hypothetical protein JR316_0000155 [Psilocybe cubensis]